MAEAHPKASRPLSPHLQIYRPMLTMMMSIFHRITGAANYFGMAILACWLAAAASGPDYFNFVSGLMRTPVGLVVLFGLTWTLMHHMLGGIRHLIWDTIHGFALPTIERLAQMTIGGSLALTVILWIAAHRMLGGF